MSGYCVLCTVQAEVIPAILESTQQGLLVGRGGYKPRDICVSAPTGSGKTLAFVIPVIQVGDLPAPSSILIRTVTVSLQGNKRCFHPQALMERVVCEVRALAVLPTKELAQQVRKFSKSKIFSVETKAQLTSDGVPYRCAKCSQRTQREPL